jgi:phage terminase Nu1 subunit (DNA packaging protein)
MSLLPFQFSSMEVRMVIKRRRFKQTQPLEVRLAEEAKRLREKARSLPSGRLRDEVEKKAIQVEAACEVTELLRLPAVTAV